MFIAAESDFSGGKMCGGEKRVAETQTAAPMGGGLRRCYADENMVGLKSSGK